MSRAMTSSWSWNSKLGRLRSSWRICSLLSIQQTDKLWLLYSVEGGELFDRIIDENYNLTELDTVLFIRQICEGLQYMHKMYILHLDLKVNRLQLRILYSQ